MNNELDGQLLHLALAAIAGMEGALAGEREALRWPSIRREPL